MSDQKIDISIIVPVYNGEKFIFNAYDNVVNQNISKLEIIFVDNNSTDNSRALINQLKDKDDRVSLITETVQGAGAARNRGVSHAQGKYIYFYDVDDTIFNGALIFLKQILEDNPSADSVFGKTKRGTENSKLMEIPDGDTGHLTKNKPPFLGIKWMTNTMSLEGTPSFLHRKSAILKVGGFDEALRVGEDALFHIKLGLENIIFQVDRHICYYYRHEDSTVSRQNKKQPHKVFTYWTQYVKGYLPYYVNHHTPNEFKIILHRYIFGSMAKMLVLTNPMKERKHLIKQFKGDILPWKIPFLLRPFYVVLIYTGSYSLYKGFYFYILPIYLRYVLLFKIRRNKTK